MEPEQLGSWNRVKVLGKGSYGTVWAGQLENGLMVAVKEIILDNTAGEDERAAFQAEFQVMESLQHVNIVRYLGHSFDGPECLTIFLEYVSGGSVGSRVRDIKKHGASRLPAVTARGYVRQTLDGLAYIHSEGRGHPPVIHRDIKGDNLLLSIEGIVKLADFGTAKMMDHVGKGGGAAVTSKDMTKTMVGTPFWMAPEVISPGDAGYGVQCDIWSLGCVLIEMYGDIPWADKQGSSPWEIMYQIAQAHGAPSNCPTEVPEQVKSFFNACFQRDPGRRQSAQQLLSHEYITCEDSILREGDSLNTSRPQVMTARGSAPSTLARN